MTYIEFFDTNALENVCSALVTPPDHVVLVGDRVKLMREHCRRYERVFAELGRPVTFSCRGINRNKLQDIVAVLTDIVENMEDCVFDLTGGDELYLVALGMVAARYPRGRVQMHRVNIVNNTLIDCDMDGVTVFSGELPSLSVRDSICICGGDVVYDDVKQGATHCWDMSGEFMADISSMWEICRRDPREWNRQIGILAAAEDAFDGTEAELTTAAPLSKLSVRMDKRSEPHPIFRKLREAGLLTQFRVEDGTLTVTYKNPQVKRCLVKAGQVLEMKLLAAALSCREEDGTPTYGDAVNGAVIDWDGTLFADGGINTENEIDLLMTHGMVPVFVSCKNGYVEIDELFKLNTVAERFGGKYAKKVLAVAELDEDDPHTLSLCRRAEDMGIRVLSDLKDKSDPELERVLRSLWRN